MVWPISKPFLTQSPIVNLSEVAFFCRTALCATFELSLCSCEQEPKHQTNLQQVHCSSQRTPLGMGFKAGLQQTLWGFRFSSTEKVKWHGLSWFLHALLLDKQKEGNNHLKQSLTACSLVCHWTSPQGHHIAGDNLLVVPTSFNSSSKVERKFGPRSDKKCSGTPCLEIACSTNNHAMVSAVWSNCKDLTPFGEVVHKDLFPLYEESIHSNHMKGVANRDWLQLRMLNSSCMGLSWIHKPSSSCSIVSHQLACPSTSTWYARLSRSSSQKNVLLHGSHLTR